MAMRRLFRYEPFMTPSLPFAYLDAEAIARRLSMFDAIDAMRAAFSDDVDNPPRVRLENSLFMPARVAAYSGVKVVCIKPGSPIGTVTLYDPEGAIVGMLDGAAVTSLRTGAASGLASNLLAREDASTLAILGAGAVSRHQVEAMLCVRPIDTVVVWSRGKRRADELARAVAECHPDVAVQLADNADAAVAMADIVCCATPSKEPLFDPAAVRPGTHINAVGAFTPQMAEVPASVVRQARVFVESRSAALLEAGDLLQAQRIPDAEISDLLAQRAVGRQRADQITLFKSVGIASQDVAAAMVALLGRQVLLPQAIGPHAHRPMRTEAIA